MLVWVKKKKVIWLQKMKQKRGRVHIHIHQNDVFGVHAWLMWETRMRALVSNTGPFNNSEQSRGHSYDLLWGYCPRGDTQRPMLHEGSKKSFQLRREKRENQCSAQNKTRPSSAAWHVITPRRWRRLSSDAPRTMLGSSLVHGPITTSSLDASCQREAKTTTTTKKHTKRPFFFYHQIRV